MNPFLDLIRDEVRALTAYHVPPATGMVKLDAMENPYRLRAPLRAEIGAMAGEAELNRYPDPTAAALKVRLREVMAIPEEAGLLLGNGSDEVIQLVVMAVARPGAVVMAPEPTFVMFKMIAAFCGVSFAGVALNADFTLNESAMLLAIERHRPAVTFIAYPNNPTGNLFDAAAIERIVAASPGFVVIDEAYFAFSPTTFMPRLLRLPNLLVMRTVSKLGLAGLRLGLLAGPPEVIAEIDKLRLPYNINVLTQRLTERILADYAALEEQAAAIRSDRAALTSALAAIPNVEPFPSDANFVSFRVPSAARVFAGLKQRAILVKDLSGAHPLLADCLRVTVGTPKENEMFLTALREIVSGS